MTRVVILNEVVLPWKWKEQTMGLTADKVKKYRIEKQYNTEDIDHEEVKEEPVSPFKEKLKKVYQGAIKGWKDKARK